MRGFEIFELKGGLMLWSRSVKVVMGAASVAVVTLAQLNLPSAAFWAPRPAVLYVAVALVVLVAFAELVGSAVYALQLSTVRRFDQDVRAVLSAGLSQVADALSAVDLQMVRGRADWRSIGVSLFHLRGMPWARRLELVEQLRMVTGRDSEPAGLPARAWSAHVTNRPPCSR